MNDFTNEIMFLLKKILVGSLKGGGFWEFGIWDGSFGDGDGDVG